VFENVIAQKEIVERLRTEIAGGSVPSSLLFSGPPYSGKATAALELARALTCERGDAAWNCTCRSCEMQRFLVHPDTLLMGPRYFLREVPACANVVERTGRPAAQFLYLRAVRKLLRRFDPVLWEGVETKRNTLSTAIQEVEDDLSPLMPGRELPEAKQLDRLLRRIEERCAKIAEAVGDSVPIGQIRNILFWAHSTAQSKAKVVIIESADRMLDASRNALLKILEEPPKDVYFILLTTRLGGVIPTIRSRLRPYHFRERDEQGATEVLSKIFREEEPEHQSLGDYFLTWGGTDVEHLRREAGRFLGGAVAGEPANQELMTLLSSQEMFVPFLEELASACGKLLPGREGRLGSLPVDRIERFARLIRDCASRREQFNQNPALLVESLYYNMREGGRG